MLSIQGTNLFDEVKTLIKDSDSTNSILYKFSHNLHLESIYSHPQTKYLRQGIVKLLILSKLMDMATIHKFCTGYINHIADIGKDVFYKIRNSSFIDWRQVLLNHAVKCMKGIDINETDQADGQACFIVDDSDLPKTGRTMEFIGKIFSHVSGRYSLGYKSLNLAYWSGKHLLHLDFSLHVELSKNGSQGLNKKQLSKRHQVHRKIKSSGYIRAAETVMKKTDSAIKMIKRALGKGLKASFILVDSWFFNSTLVKFAKAKNLTLVSRPKLNNWKYRYNSKDYTLAQLIQKFRYDKSKKWSRLLQMHYVRVPVEFQGEKLVLFFYKPKKRGTKWHVLVTTGLRMGAIQLYKIYQNRWAIEVSYKELKQHLGLGKCQSTNFNAQIADTTFSLLAYNTLSHEKAINNYQTIGQLFEKASKNWLSPTLMQRYWDHVHQILLQISELFEIDFNDILEKIFLKDNFLKKLNNTFKYLGAET